MILPLLWHLAAPLAAQTPAEPAQPAAQAPAASVQPPALPQQPQIINLSLLDSLIAVKAQDLVGVFGFIAEADAPPAMADYLLYHHGAMKLFLKKLDRDYKDAGGINGWDQLVCRYMLSIYGSGTLPDDLRLSKDYVEHISKMGLVPALPLEAITLRRKTR